MVFDLWPIGRALISIDHVYSSLLVLLLADGLDVAHHNVVEVHVPLPLGEIDGDQIEVSSIKVLEFLICRLAALKLDELLPLNLMELLTFEPRQWRLTCVGRIVQVNERFGGVPWPAWRRPASRGRSTWSETCGT